MSSSYPECAVLLVYSTFFTNISRYLLNCLQVMRGHLTATTAFPWVHILFCIGPKILLWEGGWEINQTGHQIRALCSTTPTLISKHEPSTPLPCHFRQRWHFNTIIKSNLVKTNLRIIIINRFLFKKLYIKKQQDQFERHNSIDSGSVRSVNI